MRSTGEPAQGGYSRDTLQVNSNGRVVIDAEQISSMVGAKPENKHSTLQAGEDALAAIKAALEDPELAEQAFSEEPTEYSWMEVTINSKTRRFTTQEFRFSGAASFLMGVLPAFSPL